MFDKLFGGARLPKAHVIVVFDISKSMAYPREVDRLVEDVLGHAVQMNIGGDIPVFAFADSVKREPDLNGSNTRDLLERYRRTAGRTRYTRFIREVRGLVSQQANSDIPFVVFVISDGGPNPRNESRDAQRMLEECGQPIFWLFVGYAAGSRRKFPFLEKLARMKNVGHVRLVWGVDLRKEISKACECLLF